MLAFFSVAPSDHWEHMSSYVAKSLKIIKESGLPIISADTLQEAADKAVAAVYGHEGNVRYLQIAGNLISQAVWPDE